MPLICALLVLVRVTMGLAAQNDGGNFWSWMVIVLDSTEM